MSYPLGFAVTALHSGIKKQALDLALLTSSKPCSAAGVFTSNVFKAAPVQIDQKQLALHNGRNFKSVVINSGCANAVTGRKGLQDAELMNRTASKVAGGESLCMSTGVIGQLLPIEKITKHTDLGLQQMLKQHKFGTKQAESSGENDWQTLAKGIMTTDTFPKLTSTKFKIGTHEYSIAGVAKGAGMISPNMATLLSVLATDAPVAPAALQLVLKNAVNKSFNSISVDGDMSTNDTVLMLANGVGGGPEITTNNVAELEQAVTRVCADLAKLIVKDGEGATKFVTINVKGAKTNADAKKIAKTIADSSLVKTALYGKDANWGRILCAIGYSNVEVNPLTTSVSFKPADGSADLKLLTNGEPENVDEERASEILEMPDLNIEVNLGPDEGAATFWTCDLSHEYVTINGDYRS